MANIIAKKYKHVLVDMDGVISNLELGFMIAWRNAYPQQGYIPLNLRTTFFPKPQYVEKFGKEVEAQINEIIYAPRFILNLPPITGAFEALQLMEKLGHKVTIVTAPLSNPENSFIEKPMYIEKYLGKKWTNEDHLQIRKDKENVSGDFLIDDNKEVKKNENTNWVQILYKRYPYNMGSPIPEEWRMTWQDDFISMMGL